MAGAPFADVAACALALAHTSSRLAKAGLVADLLRRLQGDEALASACRFLAGGASAPAGGPGRRLAVGPRAALAALAAATGQGSPELAAMQVRLGDLGEVAQAVLPPAATSLTLAEVTESLRTLGEAGQTAASRRALLVGLLRRATPAEGRLLVKVLLGELRMGVQRKGVEEALARAFDRPAEAVRRASMFLGDIGAVAVAARRDALAEVGLTLFQPVACMLASPLPQAMQVPADDQARSAEDKYDGIRAQAHLGGEPARVALFSRSGDDVTASFPDLVGPLQACLAAASGAWVLDAEIVAVGPGGAVGPFAALQRRLGVLAPSPSLQAGTPVCLMAFDVLCADGAPVLDLPYGRRRALLEGLPGPRGAVCLAPCAKLPAAADLRPLFAAARARGNEGLVLKAVDSAYTPGRRGQGWLKVKMPQATLDVVVTAAEVGHGRRHRWLSDVTFAVRVDDADAALVDIGRAYGGLTDRELAEMTLILTAATTSVSADGRRRQVRPQVVLEVAFDQVQVSRRHPAGFALRFPRIHRWRRDRTPADCDTLAAVRALAPTSRGNAGQDTGGPAKKGGE